MTTTHLAALAGSARAESLNRALLQLAVSDAEQAGCTVDVIEPADHSFPLFSQDLETAEGIGPDVQRLFDRLGGANGLLVASPEYNGGYTPLLKNTLDWVSRIDRAVFAPLYIGLITASPGQGGGAKSGAQLTQLFQHVGATVHDLVFSLPVAHEALASGAIDGLDEWVRGYVKAVGNSSKRPE